MENVEKEYERVAKKAKIAFNDVNTRIDKLIEALENGKKRLEEAELEQDPSIKQMKAQLALKDLNKFFQSKENSPSEVGNRMDYYKSLGKYRKTIDKNLQPLNTAFYSSLPAVDCNLLNQAVSQHLFREGQFELAKTFLKELNMEIEDHHILPFMDMYSILEDMRNHKISLAIEWATKNSEKLKQMGSDLEFNLHRLTYVDLLCQKKRQEALVYLRKHLAKFSNIHMKSIQRLSGCLLYADDLENSPYADLASPVLYQDVQQQFTSDCCELLGLPSESALFISVTAGSIALPVLAKYASLSSDPDWAKASQLPVEVDLGPQYNYHSIFTCPVSKEQSTDENPPMLPQCGHVLCKNSMEKLARGTASKFKCPYCPSEGSLARSMELKFA